MIAHGLAANGAKVYITGRRMEVLRSVAGDYGRMGGMIVPYVLSFFLHLPSLRLLDRSFPIFFLRSQISIIPSFDRYNVITRGGDAKRE